MQFQIKGEMLARTQELFHAEADASNRTAAEHLAHILSRRYMRLIRICSCGFYVYRATDDLSCHTCGARCCPWCGTSVDDRDFCSLHAPLDHGVTGHAR
jgi:hypothetical protein